VIYNGIIEASTVPPSWYGWPHHTVDVPPTQDKVTPRPWWKPHRPNLTGTPGASPDRVHPRAGQAPESDRRLQGMVAGAVTKGRLRLGSFDLLKKRRSP
jgi:NADH:ubiquinone oxidoreductase subunit